MNKINVFIMFDGQCETWNIMTADYDCLCFGLAEKIDDWLVENAAHYQECDESDVANYALNKVA